VYVNHLWLFFGYILLTTAFGALLAVFFIIGARKKASSFYDRFKGVTTLKAWLVLCTIQAQCMMVQFQLGWRVKLRSYPPNGSNTLLQPPRNE
jgi:hypothetical protein